MSFELNQEIVIGGTVYRVAEHPAVRGYPYGQEGRQGIVYQLLPPGAGDKLALKVFKPWHRRPGLVAMGVKMREFARLPGLAVCQREVLTPQEHAAQLKALPDLVYAVVMPWVAGPTWMEVMLEHRALTPDESLRLAKGFAGVLARMEQEGIAHCDLSAQNILLPSLHDGSPQIDSSADIVLVDMEQLYGPGLDAPEALPGGSFGYAHRVARDGMWAVNADRFAGALLLAEMLSWCDERVRQAACGESYFDLADLPGQSPQQSDRYELLLRVLRERWGDPISLLLDRAWRSETLPECGTFGEWLMALPEAPKAECPAVSIAVPSPPDTSQARLLTLLDQACGYEGQGDLEGALQAYQMAMATVDPESGVGEELTLVIRDLERRLQPLPAAIVPPEPPAPAARPAQRRPVLGLQNLAGLGPGGALQGRVYGAAGLAFVAGGNLLAAGFQDGRIRLWQVTDGTSAGVLEGHHLPVQALAAAPAGDILASASRDGAVRLWRMPEAERLAAPGGGCPGTAALAFSPGGDLLALGRPDGRIRLHQLHGVAESEILSGHAAGVLRLAFSPDGALLASGGHDGVRLWRTARGALWCTLKGQAQMVRALAFSPDGEALATGAGDALVRLWRVTDGRLLSTLKGHAAPVSDLAFSPDGRLLASASGDRGIRLWAAGSGQPLTQIKGHTSPISSLAFSPDGTLLVSAGYDGVRLWGCVSWGSSDSPKSAKRS